MRKKRRKSILSDLTPISPDDPPVTLEHLDALIAQDAHDEKKTRGLPSHRRSRKAKDKDLNIHYQGVNESEKEDSLALRI